MNRKGFANIVLIVVIVILVGAVGYFMLIRKPTPVTQVTQESVLESQIQLAANQALSGQAISGYQPIPEGSKLLSTKVVVNNNNVTITLDFNKATIADGQSASEDTFKFVTNTIYPIVQGKDPEYAGLQYIILIEGKLLNEVLR